jgi:hypothetical protein
MSAGDCRKIRQVVREALAEATDQALTATQTLRHSSGQRKPFYLTKTTALTLDLNEVRARDLRRTALHHVWQHAVHIIL